MADVPDEAGLLIAGQYALDWKHRLPFGGGALPAYPVMERGKPRQDLIGIPVERRLPPRALALQSLATPINGLLAPIAHGPVAGPSGKQAYVIVMEAPPGPPLANDLRAWSETELLHQVLRPAARVLIQLDGRGLTHRAINPGNVFRAGSGLPVVLGAAWAAPPAVHQPAVSEPPYSAICTPAGRGDGTIADDVYALGVLLLTLVLGRQPLSGLDDTAIIERKLELGSYAALTENARLPPVIADLLRGMLADDPDHRPSPALLSEPGSAAARRIAARSSRRAQQALLVAGRPVISTRLLARVLAQEPQAGLQLLRIGAVDYWLRRELGDPTIAARLDEAIRGMSGENSDAVTIMRAIAVLDPLAPLCWRTVTLWPDGLGPALAATDDPDAIVELITADAVSLWARTRSERYDAIALQMETRRYRGWITGRDGDGLERMAYFLNPLLPCASPLLAVSWVASLPDLLPALERAAKTVERGKTRPTDRHVIAFVAARSDRRALDIGVVQRPGAPMVIGELRLLAGLQQLYHAEPLPGLAAWVAAHVQDLLAGLHSKTRQATLAKQLASLAETGQLGPMLALLADRTEQLADVGEFQAAGTELARIDAELVRCRSGAPGRAEQARHWGQELVAGLGLAAAAAALLMTVLV
jgi:hypothetical protein